MNDFLAIEEEEQPDLGALEMLRLKKFFDLHWSTAAWERKQLELPAGFLSWCLVSYGSVFVFLCFKWNTPDVVRGFGAQFKDLLLLNEWKCTQKLKSVFLQMGIFLNKIT